MWNKNIKNKTKNTSGKNVLDGFSRILDIQNISGGGPQTPLKNEIYGVSHHFIKLSTSPLLPARQGNKSLILES